MGTSAKHHNANIFRKSYCEEHCNVGEAYTWFAFCEDLGTLYAAAEKLENLTKYLKTD